MFEIQIYKNGAFIESTKGYSCILDPNEIVRCPQYIISHWDSSITMRDFFSIIEANSEKWQNITGNIYVEDYVKEFKKVKNNPALTNSDFYYLELSWHSELWNEGNEYWNLPMYDTNEKGQELSINTRFNGVGPPDQYSSGSIEKYGIDFIPLQDMLELEIKLNPQIDVLFEDDLQNIKFSAKKKFSVADVATGIFWDLSWDGGPKEKEEALKKLVNSKKNI
jgi:hypothetical protein